MNHNAFAIKGQKIDHLSANRPFSQKKFRKNWAREKQLAHQTH